MQPKKIISGLDVMKFIMAFLIVDIHVKGSQITPPILLNYVIQPLEGLAVPTFFVISAFLFFRKYRVTEDKRQALWHFFKRLSVLYLFWCVVWSPIIYIQKEYFHPLDVMTPVYMVRDFFFGSMFDASWFLGALLVGVPLVTWLVRLLGNKLFWSIPLLVYVYIAYHCQIGDGFYTWYMENVCEGGMFLSFPESLIWISMGYLLSDDRLVTIVGRWKNGRVWLAALICFALFRFVPIAGKLVAVALLFIAAYTWKLPEHPQLYRRFRTYSILFYVIHDCFKKIPKQLFGWENGALLFCATIAFCFLASEIIMRMKELKGFGWLKYAY